MLVPSVLLKTGSTLWRFARYYLGDPAFRRKGPPSAVLRFLGPFVILLTLAVLATGVLLLVASPALRPGLLFLYKASFLLWLAAMTVHVLGHLADTARLAPGDWLVRTRRDVAWAGLRSGRSPGAWSPGCCSRSCSPAGRLRGLACHLTPDASPPARGTAARVDR